MAEIKADLPNEELTVKKRRNLVAFMANAEEEKIIVHYRERKFTGTIGTGTYKEISNEVIEYVSNWETWYASAAGTEIKAAVEVELAKAVPGQPE